MDKGISRIMLELAYYFTPVVFGLMLMGAFFHILYHVIRKAVIQANKEIYDGRPPNKP